LSSHKLVNPSDTLATLQEQVRQAVANHTQLAVQGGGSKSWLCRAAQANTPTQVLDLRPYAGIVSYEPTELVVTARAGTPLAELETELAAQGQCLPFDPPHFAHTGHHATVGGMVAAGLAGPTRLGAGAVRDYVLGAVLLSGRAEVLHFGGQVMKNVAGFDVSRLLVGSMGSLGAILEVSLKVLPRAMADATLVFDMSKERAIEQVNLWGGQPLPIAASAWACNDDGSGLLHLRLRGAQAAVTAACARLGGMRLNDVVASAFWQDLREQTLPWFATTWAQPGAAGEALWRLAVPPTTPPMRLQGGLLMEWGGAQRWLKTALPAAVLREAAARVGGHATRFRGGDQATPVFTPPPPPLDRIHRDIKRAFDPHGLFPAVMAG
jgi:glycolate oxidase FAD binding subunit